MKIAVIKVPLTESKKFELIDPDNEIGLHGKNRYARVGEPTCTVTEKYLVITVQVKEKLP